jgi:hypothetical protein
VSTAVILVALLGGALAVEASVTTRTTPSTAHGENFLFKTTLDTTFCIDEAAGATQGRAMFMFSCTTADTQRWAITKNSDGTNALIDSQGMCVDTTGRKAGDGLAIKVANCNFGKQQRFRYTASGLIQVSGTTLCFWIPLPADNAAVSLVKCRGSSAHEVFKLAH